MPVQGIDGPQQVSGYRVPKGSAIDQRFLVGQQ